MDKVLTRKLFRDVYLNSINKSITKFNEGGLASLKNKLEKHAPEGEFLAYINEREAGILKALGGSGKIIKETGIPSFDDTNSSATGSSVSPGILKQLGLLNEEGNVVGDYKPWPLYTEGQQTAMTLAPIISALLKGTRQPGQSQLSAAASNVAEGLPQAVATNLAIEKAKDERINAITKAATVANKVTVSKATPADLKHFYGDNLPDPNTIVWVKKDQNGNYVGKPEIGEDQNKQLGEATDKLNKSKLLASGVETDIDNFLNYAAPHLAKSGGKDIPGFGPIASHLPNKFIEDNGKAQQLFQNIINREIKDMDGSAVSASEELRTLKGYGGGMGATNLEPVILKLLSIKNKINLEKEQLIAPYQDQVKDDLIKKGVVSFTDMPGLYDHYKLNVPGVNMEQGVTTITNPKDGSQIKYKKFGSKVYTLTQTPAPGQSMDPYISPRRWLTNQ